MILSILWSAPVPPASKHLQNKILPPSYFIVLFAFLSHSKDCYSQTLQFHRLCQFVQARPTVSSCQITGISPNIKYSSLCVFTNWLFCCFSWFLHPWVAFQPILDTSFSQCCQKVFSLGVLQQNMVSGIQSLPPSQEYDALTSAFGLLKTV